MMLAVVFGSRFIWTNCGEAAGTVVLQDPPGSSKAERGGTVTLSVSKGPPQLFVPDVIGQAQADATTALQASGFTVNITQQPVADPAQDGVVLSSDPAGNAQTAPGSTVTLTVGLYTPTATTTPSQTIPGSPTAPGTPTAPGSPAAPGTPTQ